MPLGTFGGHLCAVASEKIDLERFWGPFWSPFGDLIGILFLLWAPRDPYCEVLEAMC